MCSSGLVAGAAPGKCRLWHSSTGRLSPVPECPGSVCCRNGGCLLLQQRQERFPGLAGRQCSAARGGFLEVGSAIFAVKCITFNLTSAVQSVCTLQMAQGLCQAAGISPAPGSVHHMDAALRVLLGKPAEPGASRALALLLGPTAQAVLQSSGSEMELV